VGGRERECILSLEREGVCLIVERQSGF
jgi:hypothetical protein